MKLDLVADADAVAQQAAILLAAMARDAIDARGKFVLAISGGTTPWKMLRCLAEQDVPWDGVHLVQVDERVAPAGDADRNLTHLHESLLNRCPLRPEQIHAMPVEDDDLDAAAERYAGALGALVGEPPVLDVVHLGLGEDGHTASLVPNDPVLEIDDRDVATTGLYQGRRRMTLTYPILNRARHRLWLITGAAKGPMLARLRDADATIPAGRIRRDQSTVIADQAAGVG